MNCKNKSNKKFFEFTGSAISRLRTQLFLSVSLFCVSLAPQLVHAQKYTIGIRTGYEQSISAFGIRDDKTIFTNTWRPGYFAAAFANLPLKDNFSFQTEAGFSKRGRAIKFNEDTWQNKSRYNYLDATMLLRKSHDLKWSRSVTGTWFLNVGPRLSYWLNGKGTVTAGGTYIDPVTGTKVISEGGSYNYKIKFATEPTEPSGSDFDVMYLRDANRFLFGIDFGIGVDAPTTSLQRFVIELRFTSMHTFYGSRDGAFNRTLGFVDNLRANEKMISLSIDYALKRDLHDTKKGKSTKKEAQRSNSKSKPRKNIDSMIKN